MARLNIAGDVSVSTGSKFEINAVDLTYTDVGAEAALGNPSTTGYILSSTDAGVRSWVANSAGTTPIDDILDWSTNKYTPYSSKQSGINFYTGTTNPDGITRLNLNASLTPTRLSIRPFYMFDETDDDVSLVVYNDLYSNKYTSKIVGSLQITADNNTRDDNNILRITRDQSYESFEDNICLYIDNSYGVNSTGILIKSSNGYEHNSLIIDGNVTGPTIPLIIRHDAGIGGLTNVCVFNPFKGTGIGLPAYVLDTFTNLTTTGDKILSVKNSGSEKFYIDKDGNINIPTGSTYQINGTPIGGSGDVTGPASSTADGIVLFNSTSGKIIKDSGITLTSYATVATPIFTSNITIGVTSSTTGSILFKGTTSGTITLKSADAAGTYTLTLPTDDGTSGQVLSTDGSGILSWVNNGSGGVPTTITVANEATDTSCYPLFVTATTGDLGPKTNTGLSFNSNTGILTATGFSGPLTGNVTGNTSGSSGSCTGNSATVTNATLTTALTVNTGTVTVKGNVANTSELTLGAGASSISGSNTGDQDLSGKQDVLVSGTNIKTINSTSLLGSGNVIVGGFNSTILTSDVVNDNATANTIADVTGLSFAVVANHTYYFKFIIQFTSAATTTGSRWSINGPATTFVSWLSLWGTGTSAGNIVVYALTTYDNPAAASSTSASTSGNTATIEGHIRPSADGTVIARFASEISNSAITAKAGSVVYYQQLD